MPDDQSEQASPGPPEPVSPGPVIGPEADLRSFTSPPVEAPEDLPPGVRFVHLESSSGPLPDPSTLAAYKELDEGLFRTIQEMAVGQAAHIQRMQQIDLQRQVDRERGGREERRRGQWMAFVIAMVGLLIALVLALTGHDVVAGVVGGATLASIVSAFIAGKVAKPKPRTKDAVEP